jgi:sec-independent protein translocase protein TatB
MPGFGDSAFIVLLALMLFGPKKLPVLARQLGKLMADFRRASNEFRTQMEEELRISEQADRQKQLAAAESAATAAAPKVAEPELQPPPPELQYSPEEPIGSAAAEGASIGTMEAASEASAQPEPIAVSGELSILPPETGLPVANTSYKAEQNGAGGGADAAHEAAGGHHEDADADRIATGAEHEDALETETLNG